MPLMETANGTPPPDGETPAELARQARAHGEASRRAYGKLYQLSYPTVYAFLLNWVDRDHAAAADLAQDVMLKGWTRLAQFQGDNPVGWFLGIARHCALDYREARKRRPGPLPDDHPEAPPDEDREPPQRRAEILSNFSAALRRFLREVEGVAKEVPPLEPRPGRRRSGERLALFLQGFQGLDPETLIAFLEQAAAPFQQVPDAENARQ
jgi:RNA polymerase sigma factor (sigma-70 family)